MVKKSPKVLFLSIDNPETTCLFLFNQILPLHLVAPMINQTSDNAFFEYLDKQEEKAQKCPICQAFSDLGFNVWTTGGGCMSLGLTIGDEFPDDRLDIQVTDADSHIDFDEPLSTIWIGVTDADMQPVEFNNKEYFEFSKDNLDEAIDCTKSLIEMMKARMPS